MDQSDLSQVATTADAVSATEIHNPDPNHQVVEMKFGFRTKKDETSGVETKRPAVEVKLPVLSFEGLVSVLKNAGTEAGKKQYELLQQAVQGVYEANIKDFLADNENITSENFPISSFTWEALANQPESERRGRGIAKEVWEDFIKSYIGVMPGLTGKPEENIKKQAAILAQKLNPLKNHEDKEKILPNFKQALTVYLNGAGADAETYAGCVEFLMNKADTLLNAEKNADLMANLGF
jgi:hypothetical protein